MDCDVHSLLCGTRALAARAHGRWLLTPPFPIHSFSSRPHPAPYLPHTEPMSLNRLTIRHNHPAGVPLHQPLAVPAISRVTRCQYAFGGVRYRAVAACQFNLRLGMPARLYHLSISTIRGRHVRAVDKHEATGQAAHRHLTPVYTARLRARTRWFSATAASSAC